MSDWVKYVYRIGPLILGLWSSTAPIAPLIVAAVANAEQAVGAGKGAEKKQYALAAIDNGLAAYNAIPGAKPISPTVAHNVSSVAIDMLVATVNMWSQPAIEHVQ